MRNSILSILLMMIAAHHHVAAAADLQRIASPGGTLVVELHTGTEPLSWTVSRGGKPLFTVTSIGMDLDTRHLGTDAMPRSVRQTMHSETIHPAVPLKYSVIHSRYTLVTIDYGRYQVQLCIMDNAVSHRFVTTLRGNVKVMGEQFTFKPSGDYTAHIQPCKSFVTSYEEPYRHQDVSAWQHDGTLATVPALLSGSGDTQLLIGESDVDDYPRMFLKAGADGITPVFPKAPLSWEPSGDRGEKITRQADYIATTQGRRTYPWRFVIVTDSPGMVEQTVPLQLARRNTLPDVSWIKPGKFSWEWWNGAAPFGPDVDFKAGSNYRTYCYYADFAAKFGIEYILLDEGWARSTRDPFHGNDDLRLPELIRYCTAKGVKIALWLPWLTVYRHMDSIFQTYERWGIPAVKIDFMDHSDQWMVNFYKQVTALAARHHIIVDWHGSFTPAGLEQEYPNLVSYEGVRGLEQMGGCRPENTVWLPFIRNAVGPADFTPGGMNNMQPEYYHASRPNSGAMGTRVFQMALYIVLESGIQMLADTPTRYYQDAECTRFIASVPTTWDQTRCLAAQAGKYVVVARRKGAKWYVSGITGNTPVELDVSLDFLGEGRHRMTVFRDGCNAGYQAMHYNQSVQTVDRHTALKVTMARNGGFAAEIDAP
ncbi:MAG: glycoside hydrolase family 97 protein [Bacteroidaceae bacterium]|nr:glycoside hydrolase family 97 protein [Bacteroidaceae bacterium]